MTTATADRTKLQARIERVRAIVDHPRTNEHLRAVAAHKLEKLLAQLAEAPHSGGYRLPDGWFGAKYDPKRSLTDVAKMIREEVKLLRKIGNLESDGAVAIPSPIADMPAGIKVSVRQPHYGAIDITLKGIPQDWGWAKGTDHRAPWRGEHWMRTPAFEALVKELKTLMGAYNYDRSDIMTDYFDVRFYGNVDIDWREDPNNVRAA
jgi:hypothetical protein